MSASNILRLSGPMNQINDVMIGTTGSPNGGPVRSHYSGQLGKWAPFDDETVTYVPSVGTLYGGEYQYVRLASGATALVAGQVVFWDPTVPPSAFQVTTAQTGSTPVATLIAGVALNPGWTPGNLSLIQISGLAYLKFRATLTVAGAVGSPVYIANSGGADLGLADVLTTDATSAANANFLGKAYDAPTNGGLARVWLAIPTRNR